MKINPNAVKVMNEKKKKDAKGWLKKRATNFKKRVGGELKFHAQVTAAERRSYREEKLKAAERRGKERAQKWGKRKSKSEMIVGALSSYGKSYAKHSKSSGLFDSPYESKPKSKAKKIKKRKYKYKMVRIRV